MEEKEQKSDDKIVAYKLLKPLDELAEGAIIHLPEAAGEALCSEGFAEPASGEDVQGGGEEESEEVADEPVVMNSIDKIADTLEKRVAVKIAKEMDRKQPTAAVRVVAEPKRPIYKSNGAYILDMIREKCGDRTAGNRIRAFEQEVHKSMPHYQDLYPTYEEVRKGGMGNFGKETSVPLHTNDIVNKSPLGINEGTNSQGGYLVNPEYSKDVYIPELDSIDLQADVGETIKAQSNTYNLRYDNMTSLANGSFAGGLNVVAVSEGSSFTSSLPAWGNVALLLQKFVQFVYITMEEIEDNSYNVEKLLDEYTKWAFLYNLNQQIVQGSTLEGLLNAPSLISVTSSSNDTAYHTTPNTNLTYADLVNMKAKFWPQAYKDAVWLFNPGLDGALNSLAFTFGGSAPAFGLTYDAQNGRQGEASGAVPTYKMFGRPMYPCWACSQPGAAGDIILYNPKSMVNFMRDFRVEVSKEFQFGTDQVAIRYVSRLDCRTRFRNKIYDTAGAIQYSQVVTRTTSGT